VCGFTPKAEANINSDGFVCPISGLFDELRTEKMKKACIKTGLLSIAKLSSTVAVRKDFEENPLRPGG
jgi:hypothetical protein